MERFILHPEHKSYRGSCIAYIQELDEGKKWQVEISKFVDSKSARQLGYLFGVIFPTIQKHIEDSCGDHYSTDNLYQWFLDAAAPHAVVEVSGVPKVVRKSASKMNVKEMSEFIDFILRHAATEMDLYIPSPEIGQPDRFRREA